MGNKAREVQPTLPLFPGEEVELSVISGNSYEPTETRRVAVDEIYFEPDELTQKALLRQFAGRLAGARHFDAVFVDAKGAFSHVMRLRRGSLFDSE